MSRRAAAAACALLICASPGAVAQEVTADEAIETAAEVYGPPPPEKTCPTVPSGAEIVVCAEQQEQSQFRYSGNQEAKERYARETMDKGAPRAPDVAGPGIFTGPATIGGLCIPGLQGCPPPPAYIVDFAALPEAPPGSDADRVSRGLAPTGDEAGTAPPPAASPPADAPAGKGE